MQEFDIVLARKVLAGQPFSSLLGTRVMVFGDGEAELELDIREDLKQQNGYLHGECWRTRRTTASHSLPARCSVPPY